MGEWQAWFGMMGERIVEQGGLWGPAREFTNDGVTELSMGPDSTTGYMIFTAEDIGEAESLVQKCPVVAANRVYEIMQKG